MQPDIKSKGAKLTQKAGLEEVVPCLLQQRAWPAAPWSHANLLPGKYPSMGTSCSISVQSQDSGFPWPLPCTWFETPPHSSGWTGDRIEPLPMENFSLSTWWEKIFTHPFQVLLEGIITCCLLQTARERPGSPFSVLTPLQTDTLVPGARRLID